MIVKRQYLVNEDLLNNWRNRLVTARRYSNKQEQAEDALDDVMGAIDSILASGNYQEK